MHYIETGSVDPCYNLAFEEYILTHKTEGDWLILWQNRNTVVIGLNQNAIEEVNLPFIQEHSTTVVRRSTGGGAVYHDMGNLNYSFITDLGESRMVSMERLTRPVCAALRAMGVPAEVSGRNDITVEGQKVSGTAQRIEGKRILHHGTLLFSSDLELVAGALRVDPEKFQSKSIKSVRARVGNLKDFLPAGMTIDAFWQALKEHLLSGKSVVETLTPSELEEIRTLADTKYRSWERTWGRSPACTLRQKRRLPGGTLEALLSIKDGCIQDITFCGDFMATTDCTPAQDAIRGCRYDRDAVAALLAPLDLAPMFGGITQEEILGTVFGDPA